MGFVGALAPQRCREAHPVLIEKPTFDEWHLAKYKQTFDDRWMFTGVKYDDIFRAMMEDIRQYATEMVTR